MSEEASPELLLATMRTVPEEARSPTVCWSRFQPKPWQTGAGMIVRECVVFAYTPQCIAHCSACAALTWSNGVPTLHADVTVKGHAVSPPLGGPSFSARSLTMDTSGGSIDFGDRTLTVLTTFDAI